LSLAFSSLLCDIYISEAVRLKAHRPASQPDALGRPVFFISSNHQHLNKSNEKIYFRPPAGEEGLSSLLFPEKNALTFLVSYAIFYIVPRPEAAL
jgi:hypothetical protein